MATYGRTGNCRKRGLALCASCESVKDRSRRSLYEEYGCNKKVPCDRVDEDGKPISTEEPSTPEERPPSPLASHQRRRRSLSEAALAQESITDSRFEAGPANNAKMHRERRTARPAKKKPSEAARRKAALKVITGDNNVNTSRGGTSRSAVNKVTATANAAVHGLAETIAPRDTEQGLLLIQAATERKLEQLRAKKAEKSSAETDEPVPEDGAAEEAAASAAEAEPAATSSSSTSSSIAPSDPPADGRDDDVTPGSSCSSGCGGCSRSRINIPGLEAIAAMEIVEERDERDGGEGEREGEGSDMGEDQDGNADSAGKENDTAPKKAPTAPKRFHLDTPPPHLTTADKKLWYIFKSMDQETADWFVNQPPDVRKPVLAFYTAHHKKPEVEKRLGIKIYEHEWNRATHHFVWPGPFVPEPPAIEENYRCKIPISLIEKLIHVAFGHGNCQQYAYGRRLLALCGGSVILELDNVDRLNTARQITAQYIMAVMAEVDEVCNIPDEERCDCVERDTFRRCLLRKGHKSQDAPADVASSRCKFTPKEAIGRTAALEMVKGLTGNDIKALSGLDDTRMICGRENFITIRRLIDELCDADKLGLTTEADKEALRKEKEEMKKTIDKTEIFYKTEYYPHVEEGGYACCCTTCGFFDADGRESINCPDKGSHKRSCNKCSMGYGVIIKLQKYQRKAASLEGQSVLDKQKLDQTAQELSKCMDNLDEYRSHLARQIWEGKKDAEEMRNLSDDTARVTSDWKHKILECYFRENMKKYFGKKGTSMLGFMIMYNSTNPEERAKGIKEVRFVMLLTDDSLQDEWAVAVAKEEIYKNHIPDHCTKVIFVADGASCFASVLHRAIQPLWGRWTGVEEVVFRITVAGDGKSSLDGMFGRTSCVLVGSNNNGYSYFDAPTILRALEAGSGLAATAFAIFAADRAYRLYARNIGSISLESVLRTELMPNGDLMAYTHSGVGGFRIDRHDLALFDEKPPQNLSNAFVQEKNLLLHADTDASITNRITQFLIDSEDNQDEASNVPLSSQIDSLVSQVSYRADIAWAGLSRSIIQAPLQKFEPVYGNNKKGELRSTSSAAMDNESRVQQQHKKRKSRVQARADKKEAEILQRREEKKSAGKLLCDERCPDTHRFCRKEYLPGEEKWLEKHVANGKHDFPVGMRAMDKAALILSRPGGVMAGGSLPDRSNRVTVNVEEMPEETEATIVACCYGKFNRRSRTANYNKPEPLKQWLKEKFDQTPVLKPQDVYAEMVALIDPKDGGLMFCWSKRGEVGVVSQSNKEKWEAWPGCSMCGNKPCTGCNGKRMSVEEIKSYFSSLGQKRKRDARGNAEGDGGDGMECFTVAQLKEKLKAYGEKLSGKKAELVNRLRAARQKDTSIDEDVENDEEEALDVTSDCDSRPRKRARRAEPE